MLPRSMAKLIRGTLFILGFEIVTNWREMALVQVFQSIDDYVPTRDALVGGPNKHVAEVETMKRCPEQLVFAKSQESLNSTSLQVNGSVLPEPQRRRNLNIAFIGDSVTRYQYLSLINHVHTGRWVNKQDKPSLVSEWSHQTWDQFFNYTANYFGTSEVCDCYRPLLGKKKRKMRYDLAYENRYYRDACRQNFISFITSYGEQPQKGHYQANETDAATVPFSIDSLPDPSSVPPSWSYSSIHDTISNYVAHLTPKPHVVVVNTGLWKKNQLETEPNAIDKVLKALRDAGMIGIYKTTTNMRVNRGRYKVIPHDVEGCRKFEYCLNTTWTAELGRHDYSDGMHPKAHAYERLNRELLQILDEIDAST